MKIIKSIAPQAAMPLFLGISLLSFAPGVFAHGGEDHGDSAPVVQAAQPLAPRAEAKSDDVELLAVYQNKELTLYLSRFGTNEPISNAQIEIESGQQKAIAKAGGDGRYTVATPWLAKPGKHELVATIQSQSVSDLLETSIDIKDAAQTSQSEKIARFAPAGMIASLGGATLLGMLYFGRRRRNK